MADLGDFLNSINYSKVDVFKTDPTAEKDYIPFIINKGLSIFQDTIFIANELNRMHSIPKHNQYRFALNTVRSRKRFDKWPKKIRNDDVELIKKYYGYNNQLAESALSILTKEQIEIIKTKYELGGNNGSKK